jgi:S-DNA-T family DNA segregation ATPase FtsK/SpoIIIE
MDHRGRIPVIATVGCLAALGAALVVRTVPGIPWWAPGAAGAILGAFAGIVCLATLIPLATGLHRVVCVAAVGAWASWASWHGMTPLDVVWLLLAAAVLALLAVALPTVGETVGPEVAPRDRRPDEVRALEDLLRRLTKQPTISVSRIDPWERPKDGLRAHVDLPEGMTIKDLAGYCDRIASSPVLRLPQGCAVRALDGAYQCEAVLDIMTRDCLADTVVIDEPATPASVRDEFTVVCSPRGERLSICLRIMSMVVGGTIGSGKTTLLHRIIMWLARCTDALVWIIDMNGGGLGAPWAQPYLDGKTDRPTVDWIADCEEEAALMTAVAKAVLIDRKTSPQARAARRAANTNVMPVSADLPAIIIIADEGGEIRQTITLLGRLAGERISSIAQIGRETAGRVVLSVLRGTSDLLDKGFRAVAGLRLCLRMDEEGEADHILGRNPGRTPLLHVGSAWLYRSGTDYRPILGRTVDIPPDAIERHALATARLRPQLDERGQLIASQVDAVAVLGGIRPDNIRHLLSLPPLADAAAGHAYSMRWRRYRDRLAARDGTGPVEPIRPADSPTVAPAGSSMERLLMATGVTGQDGPEPGATPEQIQRAALDAVAVGDEFAALTSAEHFVRDAQEPRPVSVPARVEPITGREMILAVLQDAHPDGLTAGQIETQLRERGTPLSRGRLYELLRDMQLPRDGQQYLYPER